MVAYLFANLVHWLLDTEWFSSIDRLAVCRVDHGQLVRQGRVRQAGSTVLRTCVVNVIQTWIDFRCLECVCLGGEHHRCGTSRDLPSIRLRVSVSGLCDSLTVLWDHLSLRHCSLTGRCWSVLFTRFDLEPSFSLLQAFERPTRMSRWKVRERWSSWVKVSLHL